MRRALLGLALLALATVVTISARAGSEELPAPKPAPSTPTAPAQARVPPPASYASLAVAERRALYQTLNRGEQQALLASLSEEELVAIGRSALAALGTYEATVVKQERIKGELQPAQTLHVGIRSEPYAIRMEVVKGAGEGRRVLYNRLLRPAQLRAREPGVLGIIGGIWVDIDSSLTRSDSNHPITDTGFATTLRIMEGDVQAARPAGGLERHDEGFDAGGLYCLRATAPVGAKTYARKSRLCFDPQLELPVSVECADAQGVFERFNWSNVHPRAFSDADFTPDALGI